MSCIIFGDFMSLPEYGCDCFCSEYINQYSKATLFKGRRMAYTVQAPI